MEIQNEFYTLIEKARRCERFSYDPDFLNDPNSDKPNLRLLNNLRSAARHLQLLCLREQVLGNADKALDACAAILDMNQSLNDEPWLMGRRLQVR